MKFWLVALLMIGITGCATTRPILYSNQKYQQVGKTTADHDVAECRTLADQAGATPDSAVVGAASGAVGGAIGGSPGIGAAAGAAGGVVWSLLWGWMTPTPTSNVHMNYVNQCLADRGYQVAGWK
jgi:hypothetical protein